MEPVQVYHAGRLLVTGMTQAELEDYHDYANPSTLLTNTQVARQTTDPTRHQTTDLAHGADAGASGQSNTMNTPVITHHDERHPQGVTQSGTGSASNSLDSPSPDSYARLRVDRIPLPEWTPTDTLDPRTDVTREKGESYFLEHSPIPQGGVIISMPAIKGDGDIKYPTTGTRPCPSRLTQQELVALLKRIVLHKFDATTLRNMTDEVALSQVFEELSVESLYKMCPDRTKYLNLHGAYYKRAIIIDYTEDSMSLLDECLLALWTSYRHDADPYFKGKASEGLPSLIPYLEKGYVPWDRPWVKHGSYLMWELLSTHNMDCYMGLADSVKQGTFMALAESMIEQFIFWIVLPTLHYAGLHMIEQFIFWIVLPTLHYAGLQTYDTVFLRSYIRSFFSDLYGIAKVILDEHPADDQPHALASGKINRIHLGMERLHDHYRNTLAKYTQENRFTQGITIYPLESTNHLARANLAKRLVKFYHPFKYIKGAFEDGRRQPIEDVRLMRKEPHFAESPQEIRGSISSLATNPRRYYGTPAYIGEIPHGRYIPVKVGETYEPPARSNYIQNGRAIDVANPLQPPYGKCTHLDGRWVYAVVGCQAVAAWERYQPPLHPSEIPGNVHRYWTESHWEGKILPNGSPYTPGLFRGLAFPPPRSNVDMAHRADPRPLKDLSQETLDAWEHLLRWGGPEALRRVLQGTELLKYYQPFVANYETSRETAIERDAVYCVSGVWERFNYSDMTSMHGEESPPTSGSFGDNEQADEMDLGQEQDPDFRQGSW